MIGAVCFLGLSGMFGLPGKKYIFRMILMKLNDLKPTLKINLSAINVDSLMIPKMTTYPVDM